MTKPRHSAFARSRPDNLVLLIDTYDTEAAARKVVDLAPRLKQEGIRVRAVRLDSGDLVALSKSVRRILNAGGLQDVTIFASGGLDEDELARMMDANAPIDGFGIGTSLTTSSDAPALDCAYKLQEYAGIARRKRSAGKATWPGRKQVWRSFGGDGRVTGDIVALQDDQQAGEPLLVPVMRRGRRLASPPPLDHIRQRAARGLAELPEPLRRLKDGPAFSASIAPGSIRRSRKKSIVAASRDCGLRDRGLNATSTSAGSRD